MPTKMRRPEWLLKGLAERSGQLSDDNLRWVYQLLIGLSFEDPDQFETLQSAWNTLAEAIGIEEMSANGHGPVRRTG